MFQEERNGKLQVWERKNTMISKSHFETMGLLRGNLTRLQKSLTTAFLMDRFQLGIYKLHFGFCRSRGDRNLSIVNLISLHLPIIYLIYSSTHPFIIDLPII